VNFKFQEEAAKVGANAVINVTYSRGMSLTSYEVLKAVGMAVLAESDEMPCPSCAEMIKRAAKKCKHCGEMMSDYPPPLPARPEPGVDSAVVNAGSEARAWLILAAR
jgi:hypothetical protein